MKLMRVGQAGQEIPCILDAEGQIRDASGIVPDITADTVATLTALSPQDLAALPVLSPEGRRIGAPVAQPPNIWCIGLNFSDHAEEADMAIPTEPIIFSKARCSYCGPNDPTPFVPDMTKLDWEVELGVVISKPAFRIDQAAALDHVLGYTIVNDVSERAWQLERGGQWIKGKTFPNFCPTGPWLVTPDDVPDPQDLAMTLTVNGTVMQDGSSSRMIFGVAEIIAYMSRFCRLEAGDLICTGTPAGVGMGHKPPRYLGPGDTVALEIAGLGRQAQTVEAME